MKNKNQTVTAKQMLQKSPSSNDGMYMEGYNSNKNSVLKVIKF